MALTQISTAGVKDDAISAGKIPANAVGSSEIADDAVDQGAIADEAVDEARLQISNAGTNGQFLSKQSGNTGGLTWADGASEGTEVKSTGESGTTKFLRTDGDGTCSWQVPPDNNTVYTHPNHSGEVTSSADGAQTIASNVVDEDNLKISNAGTNGQYLQKQSGNTGGLTWADVTIPPAGNTVDLVADGAIAAGKPVVIKTNGKAAQIAEGLTGISLDSGFSWNGTATNATTNNVANLVGGCYDATADKWLTWWVNTDDSSKPKLTIWRYTGSSDACTQNTFSMSAGTGATGLQNSTDYEGDVIYDPSTAKVMGVYRHQDGKGKCWIGTTTTGSTNSFTVGYCRDFESGNTKNFSLAYSPDDQKSLVTFCDESDSGKGKAVVITTTTSGGATNGDMSFGSTVEFNNNNTNGTSVIYDTHNDKFVVFWQGWGNYLLAKIGDISGTTISWGAEQSIENSATQFVKAVYTKNGVIYVQYGRQSKLRGRVVTSNGSSLTVGSEIEVQNYWDEFHKVRYDSFNDMVYSAHDEGSGNANLKLQKITISGTTPTKRGSTTRYYGNIGQRGLGEYNNGRTPLFYFANDAGSKYLHGLPYRTANIETNVTTSSSNSVLNYTNILGFAEDAISDGATGTIKLPGNVVANQSGLTAGTYYYHNGDGSLTTSGSTPLVNAKAGIAVSSSKLVIADPNQQSQ